MPLTNPPAGSSGTPIGNMGILATTPANVSSSFSWVYNTNDKALGAYTPNAQNTAFVGGLLDLLQAARLTDLNATRVALENLRLFVEDIAQHHNAVSIALRDAGIIAN